jgi:hypothetical protein
LQNSTQLVTSVFNKNTLGQIVTQLILNSAIPI